jgi:hypothetical protein
LQLVKKFPAFYRTRKFVTAFTNARHISISLASPIQSIPPYPTNWISMLILSIYLRLGLPIGLFPSGFLTKTTRLCPSTTELIENILQKGTCLRWGGFSTSPSLQAGIPLLESSRLLIQYIHTYPPYWGTRCRSVWGTALKTGRSVAGSIPDGVTGIFHWHNPPGRNMALGSTQPLTEMSTRNFSWG